MRHRNERPVGSYRMITIAAVLAWGGLGVLCAQRASADMIDLDAAAQGKGNKGTAYRPLDDQGVLANFVITARSHVNKDDRFNGDAWGQQGTVYVDDHGVGVQNADMGGSKGISGGGGDQDEEVIVTYDSAVLAGSVQLGLYDIEFGHGLYDKDDPVLFVMLAGSDTWSPAILEWEMQNAFTSTGDKRGFVDFGQLSSLSPDMAIAAFKFRETRDHDYVSMVSSGTAVPEPATLALLAGGGLFLLRRRRRA